MSGEDETLPALRASTELSPRLAELGEQARQIIAEGIPRNTARTYRSQWTKFLAWCDEHGQTPMPVSAEALILYLTDCSKEVKVSTIRVALSAITVAHREAGLGEHWSASDLPGVRLFMRGLQRKKGTEPDKKRAFMLSDLQRGLPRGKDEQTARDRAVLLLGFFSAMRRSELSALDVEDLRLVPNGLRIYVRQSKTDQEARGQVVFVPEMPEAPAVCPVSAVRHWLKTAERKNGPLFVSMRSGSRLLPSAINEIVKSAAARAGFDPSEFGAHSLRSGFATSAAAVNAEERDIMNVTRHTSERTVRGYIQEGKLGESHPGRQIVAGLLAKEEER